MTDTKKNTHIIVKSIYSSESKMHMYSIIKNPISNYVTKAQIIE